MVLHSTRNRKRIRLAGLILCCDALLMAQAAMPADQPPLTDRERALLDRIDVFEKRVTALEGKAPAAAERANVLKLNVALDCQFPLKS